MTPLRISAAESQVMAAVWDGETWQALGRGQVTLYGFESVEAIPPPLV